MLKNTEKIYQIIYDNQIYLIIKIKIKRAIFPTDVACYILCAISDIIERIEHKLASRRREKREE